MTFPGFSSTTGGKAEREKRQRESDREREVTERERESERAAFPRVAVLRRLTWGGKSKDVWPQLRAIFARDAFPCGHLHPMSAGSPGPSSLLGGPGLSGILGRDKRQRERVTERERERN